MNIWKDYKMINDEASPPQVQKNLSRILHYLKIYRDNTLSRRELEELNDIIAKLEK